MVTVLRARYAVVGDPISHSLSPLIHNGWMADYGVAERYDRIRIPAHELPQRLESLAREGVIGLNVTLPHKAAALALAETSSQTARRVGAANMLTRTAGGWVADNTDVEGFALAVDRLTARLKRPRPRHILILGAGGAAGAVADWAAAQDAGLTILNRTPERAQALAARVSAKACAGGMDRLAEAARDADLVVNTASLGHEGGWLELPPGEGRLLLDISYGQAADSVLVPARALGWQTEDGLAMLVGQAGAAFRQWFGVEPDFETGLLRAKEALTT